MIDWALFYAGQGIAVLPLHSIHLGRCTCEKDCASPGKHPIYAPGVLENGVKGASKDVSKIRRWWERWPTANIGLATGRQSDLFVIDVDGKQGERSLKRLQRRYGKLPKTLIAQTGNGAHVFFRSGGREIKNHVGIVPGVDIRGCGGYVVAAPSLHISGKRYRFSTDAPIAEPPRWVVQMLQSEKKTKPKQQHYDRPKPHLRPCDVPLIEKGSRNAQLCKWAGRWVWEDKSLEEVQRLLEELNNTRCKPPVSSGELRSIMRSVKRW